MIKPWIVIGLCAVVVTCSDTKQVSSARRHVARSSHDAKPKPSATPIIIEHEGKFYKIK